MAQEGASTALTAARKLGFANEPCSHRAASLSWTHRKTLENEHLQLQSSKVNSHPLVQHCIHFNIFKSASFAAFQAVHSAIQNSLLLKQNMEVFAQEGIAALVTF